MKKLNLYINFKIKKINVYRYILNYINIKYILYLYDIFNTIFILYKLFLYKMKIVLNYFYILIQFNPNYYTYFKNNHYNLFYLIYLLSIIYIYIYINKYFLFYLNLLMNFKTNKKENINYIKKIFQNFFFEKIEKNILITLLKYRSFEIIRKYKNINQTEKFLLNSIIYNYIKYLFINKFILEKTLYYSKKNIQFYYGFYFKKNKFIIIYNWNILLVNFLKIEYPFILKYIKKNFNIKFIKINFFNKKDILFDYFNFIFFDIKNINLSIKIISSNFNQFNYEDEEVLEIFIKINEFYIIFQLKLIKILLPCIIFISNINNNLNILLNLFLNKFLFIYSICETKKINFLVSINYEKIKLLDPILISYKKINTFIHIKKINYLDKKRLLFEILYINKINFLNSKIYKKNYFFYQFKYINFKKIYYFINNIFLKNIINKISFNLNNNFYKKNNKNNLLKSFLIKDFNLIFYKIQYYFFGKNFVLSNNINIFYNIKYSLNYKYYFELNFFYKKILIYIYIFSFFINYFFYIFFYKVFENHQKIYKNYDIFEKNYNLINDLLKYFFNKKLKLTQQTYKNNFNIKNIIKIFKEEILIFHLFYNVFFIINIFNELNYYNILFFIYKYYNNKLYNIIYIINILKSILLIF